MEPLENSELPERELDGLLQEWRTPRAPERLRRSVFPGGEPWWRGFWHTSIHLPLPVACGLLIVVLVMVWQRQMPRAPAPSGAIPSSGTRYGAQIPRFEAVRELQPRIIKEQDAQ